MFQDSTGSKNPVKTLSILSVFCRTLIFVIYRVIIARHNCQGELGAIALRSASKRPSEPVKRRSG